MRAGTIRVCFGVLLCGILSLAFTACSTSSGSPCIGCLRTGPPVQSYLIAAGEPNLQSSQLLSFSVDSATGALGSPATTAGPTPPLSRLIGGGGTPSLVYVATDQSPLSVQVYGYAISSDGILAQLSSSPFPAPEAVGVNSGLALNGYLYLGAAAQLSNGLAPAVEAFSIGTDGSLSTPVIGSPFLAAPPTSALGGNGPALATSENYVYAAESNGLTGATGGIAAFSIDQQNGALFEIAGSPFSTGSYGTPGQILLDDYGFVYVTLSNPPNGQNYIAGFAVDNSTGALTPVPGSPFAVDSVSSPVLDLSGVYLFSGVDQSQTIDEFQVNTTTGTLTPVTGSAAKVFSPFVIIGSYLYAPNSTNLGSTGAASAIAAFSIDETTGALTQIQGSPFAAGVPIVSMTSAVVP